MDWMPDRSEVLVLESLAHALGMATVNVRNMNLSHQHFKMLVLVLEETPLYGLNFAHLILHTCGPNLTEIKHT